MTVTLNRFYLFFLKSASLGYATTDLYIVGNGLGLVWNQLYRLTKSAKDTWTLDINFTGSWDGYVCSTLDKQPCTNKNSLPPQDRFEYRIMTSNSGDMVCHLIYQSCCHNEALHFGKYYL